MTSRAFQRTLLSLVILALATPAVHAGIATVAGANVVSVLIQSDTTFGGCMAKLSVDPSTLLPACAPHWVTFSCSGDFTSEVRAYRMLDQAQLALATSRRVQVVVDDSRRHNGYCFATRIDVNLNR